MRAMIRLIDWIGRALDVRDFFLLLATALGLTGLSLHNSWVWFQSLPVPTQWLWSATIPFVVLGIGGYIVALFHRPKGGPFLFDEQHLQRTTVITAAEIERSDLKSESANVLISFEIFNGTGFEIEIQTNLAGRVSVRGDPCPLPAEIVLRNGSAISRSSQLRSQYGGRCCLLLRQRLPEPFLGRALKFAKSPTARQINKMFSGPENATIVFSFEELQVSAIARNGKTEQVFAISLPIVELEIKD